MKKLIITLALALLYFCANQAYSQLPECSRLLYPNDPQSGYFNPDSVKVDTCSQGHDLYGKKTFYLMFIYNPFGDKNADSIVNWTDIDSNFSYLKSRFQLMDSIFGSFQFIKQYRDSTDTSNSYSKYYQIIFNDYVNINAVQDTLKSISALQSISFYQIPSQKTCTNNSYQSQGEFIFGYSTEPRSNLDGGYHQYSNHWHLFQLKIPMAWEITTGDPDIFIGCINESWPLCRTFNNVPDYLERLDKNTYDIGHGIGEGIFQSSPDPNRTGDFYHAIWVPDSIPQGFIINTEGGNVVVNLDIDPSQPTNHHHIYSSLYGNFGNCPNTPGLFYPGTTDHAIMTLAPVISKLNNQGITGVSPNCRGALFGMGVYDLSSTKIIKDKNLNEYHYLSVIYEPEVAGGLTSNPTDILNGLPYISQYPLQYEIDAINNSALTKNDDFRTTPSRFGIEQYFEMGYNEINEFLPTNDAPIWKDWDNRIPCEQKFDPNLIVKTQDLWPNKSPIVGEGQRWTTKIVSGKTYYSKYPFSNNYNFGGACKEVYNALDLIIPSNIPSLANGGGYKLGEGQSTATGLLAGIIALMRSVDLYMGMTDEQNKIFSDQSRNKRPIPNSYLLTSQAYNIATFTAEKVEPYWRKFIPENPPIPAHNILYKKDFTQPNGAERYIRQVDETNYKLPDPLDRWWSPFAYYGKPNAFRCVMHSIPAKADYIFDDPNELYNLSDNHFQQFSLCGKHYIHFGSWIQEGQWVNELFNLDANSNVLPFNQWTQTDPFKNVDIDGKGTNHDYLKVLEYGGRHFPGNTTERWKNNWGETILHYGITITVSNNYVACIDGILRQPNEPYEPTIQNLCAGNKFITTDNGKILITGYLRDVELNGKVKTDDLEIHSTAGHDYGRIIVRSPIEDQTQPLASEIFGKVNVYEDSYIQVGDGSDNIVDTLIMQPGGEINLKGTKGIEVKNLATLVLNYGSTIKKDPENTNNVKILVKNGGTLKVSTGAAVTLDVPLLVEEGGKIIFEDHTLAWIDNIDLQKGGHIVGATSLTDLNNEAILIPANGKTGKVVLESEATLTINNPNATKPIALVGGVYLKSAPWLDNNNQRTDSRFTKFEVKDNSVLDLGQFTSERYTSIIFDIGSHISLLSNNTANNPPFYDNGIVIEDANGKFTVIGATVKGFDATDRKYNCTVSSFPYVLAEIRVYHNWTEFMPTPVTWPPPNPLPQDQPTYFNEVSLNGSNFNNVTFKFINSIRQPISGCKFVVDGDKIRQNWNNNTYFSAMPTSILDFNLGGMPWLNAIFIPPPTIIPDLTKYLDLSVNNSSFKNTIDPDVINYYDWLTHDFNPSSPSESVENYLYHLNGITVKNLQNISVIGNDYLIPPFINPSYSDYEDNVNYDFVGLNCGVSTVSCRTVNIKNTRFLHCRVASFDHNSSVDLCHNYSYRVNTLNSLNSSKRWITSDNLFNQSDKVANLFGVLSGQGYVSNSFNDFYNGMFIENSKAILRYENTTSSDFLPWGDNTFDIPQRNQNNEFDRNNYLTYPNNPFTAGEKFNPTSFPYRADIFLNRPDANLLIDFGFNNMAEFTQSHVFYLNPNDQNDIKTINLRFNNWRDPTPPNYHLLRLYHVISSPPCGVNCNNQIIEQLPFCDIAPISSTIPNNQVFDSCDYFVRNQGIWPYLTSTDSVLENDFYAYLNDFCNGILSCKCYRQRLFDLMQLAVLGTSTDAKLQMIINCILAKMNDPVYNYQNCDISDLMLQLGEAYERKGLADSALTAYYYILTNSHNHADTTLARWRIMNIEAIQADTTFGAIYDSLMSLYYQRVDRDITATVHGDTSSSSYGRIAIHETDAKPLQQQEIKDEETVLAELEQNAPNPFTNETIIVFHLNREADVRLGIHDALGQTIKEVVNQRLRKGKYIYTFQNEGRAAGVYLYMLTTDGKQIVKKMQLIK